MLTNHPPASASAELDNAASAATLDTAMSEVAPTLDELVRAIRRLKNGKAAGPDGITAELLKFAEEPISRAPLQLFTRVWTVGKVQAEWKQGIIVSLYLSLIHI